MIYKNTVCALFSTVFLLLGSPTDAQPDEGNRELLYQTITREQEKDIEDRAFPLMTAKWPQSYAEEGIFVCWEEFDALKPDDLSLVQDSIKDTWGRFSTLNFVGWRKCNEGQEGIRISVRDQAPKVEALGKYINGVENGMILNFNFGFWGRTCLESDEKRAACIRMTAVHEFGHAIGFAHEHLREDTPDDCDEPKIGTPGDTEHLTPWDQCSAMNYCSPVVMGDGVLSQFDVLAVQYIYGTGGYDGENLGNSCDHSDSDT